MVVNTPIHTNFTETPTKSIWWLPPLYKINERGKESSWQVGFDTITSELIMQFGQVGGAIRETRTKVVPKAKRTLQEQGFLEAKSRYEKKSREDNYLPRGSQLPPPGTIFKPMLANEWKPGVTKLPFPVWTQPKVDGVRMFVWIEEGEIRVRSRNNKPFYFLEHITESLPILFDNLPEGSILDGELYSLDYPFDVISGIARQTKNKKANTDVVEYFLFDVILPEISIDPLYLDIIYDNHEHLWEPPNIYATYRDLPFNYRYTILLDAYNQSYGPEEEGQEPEYTPIKLLTVDEAKTEKELLELHDRYVQEGFEGLIIRNIAFDDDPSSVKEKAKYKFGRGNIYKYKDFKDEETEIVDVVSGKGTEEGLAVLVVKDIRGNILHVRPRGSFEVRREWLEDPSLVIGKQYTIRYQELTPEGKPRFPTGVAIRDYE